MAYYTTTEARDAGRARARRDFEPAGSILEKAARSRLSFDIFLSHSSSDAELILGLKALLERSGKTVYVDWIDDPQLDRSQVTSETARQLRNRMDRCNSLVYVVTRAAATSKWMPWELGYFDGKKNEEAVAILPVVDYEGQVPGQEYLGLYPHLEKMPNHNLLPVVTRRVGARYEAKSVDSLVAGRGGNAWMS